MWWVTAAFAWDVNSVDWVYQEARIEEPFVLNADSFTEIGSPDDVEATFEAAIATWNTESDADLYVIYGGRSNETKQGGGDDGVNVSVYGSRDFAAGLAVSTIGFSGKKLNDCDTTFHRRNGYGDIQWYIGPDTAPKEAFDLANTMTHELGHCIGMNHSAKQSAIMYAYSIAGTGEERRHLTDDDRAGIQFLYGKVAPELALEDAAPTGPLTHGQPVEIEVSVRNIGDGTAWLATADVTGPDFDAPLALGPIGAPTPVGARVGPDIGTAVFTWTVDCALTTADFEVTATDYRGRSWSLPFSVAPDCAVPTTPTGTDTASTPTASETGPGEAAAGGCACDAANTPSAGFGLAAAALALAGLRRRSVRTASTS